MSSSAFFIGVIGFQFLLAAPSFANHHSGKHRHQVHHEHSAHSHGSGTLNIAFDAEKGTVEFKAAAESILGFEYEASNDKDKKTVAEMTRKFETDIAKMIEMDPALGCQFQKEKISQVSETEAKGKKPSKHSDWSAIFSIICKGSPVGTTIKVDFSSFKSLKDLDITILASTLQKSAEYNGMPVAIELK